MTETHLAAKDDVQKYMYMCSVSMVGGCLLQMFVCEWLKMFRVNPFVVSTLSIAVEIRFKITFK